MSLNKRSEPTKNEFSPSGVSLYSHGSTSRDATSNSPFSDGSGMGNHTSEGSSNVNSSRRGGRAADDPNKRTHYRSNFFSIPDTHAYDIYCDFEYNNYMPGTKSKLHNSTVSNIRDIDPTGASKAQLPASSLESIRGIMNNEMMSSNKRNTAHNVDIFGSVVPNLTASCPDFAKRRKIGTNIDTDQMKRTHALAGASYKWTESQKAILKKRKEEEVEALFLRRPILVQNDLYSKGDQIVVGAEAAEKNLPRRPLAETSPEEVLNRIEDTFSKAKNLIPKHPTWKPSKDSRGIPNKEPKLVSRRALLPNANNWGKDFCQIQFDEETKIPENDDSPAIFWGEEMLGKTVFGLLRSDLPNLAPGEHKLERPYVWSNRGEFESTRHIRQYLLLHVSNKKNQSITFNAIRNKIMVKKMLAQMQSGSTGLSDFNINKKRIEWRDDTEKEQAQETQKLMEVVIDPKQEREGRKQ